MSFCTVCNNLNIISDINKCTACGNISQIDPKNNIVYTFTNNTSGKNTAILNGIDSDPCGYKIYNICEVCKKNISVVILGDDMDVIFKCECDDDPVFDRNDIQIVKPHKIKK